MIGFTAELIDNNKFSFKFKQVSRSISHNSFKDECINAVNLIRQSTDKPIIVANSGGQDSEVVCWTLLEAGIPFETLTLVQTKGTNYHDIKYALDFSSRYNIVCHQHELDLDNFFKVKIPQYISEGYLSRRIHRYVQLYLLEIITKLGGCGILGGGEQIYITDRDNVVKQFIESAHVNCLQWCYKNNVIHYPYFYQSTPELIAAYLQNDIVRSLLKYPDYFARVDGKNPSHYLKSVVYNHYFRKLDMRIKLTGYEHVKNLVDQTEAQLNKFNQFWIGISIEDIRLQLGIN